MTICSGTAIPMSEALEKSPIKTCYKRILIKLSGEALMGDQAAGIDVSTMSRLAQEIVALSNQNIQISLVLGGGNIFRGFSLEKQGVNRITGDYMGMLATMMNALAMRDTLIHCGGSAQVLSSIPMDSIAPTYQFNKAIQLLQKNTIVICAGGLGNPLFTTDTAACLRGIEMDVDLVIKATKVDGVYDSDPNINANAKRYQTISYDEVLAKQLKVMDLTAICLMKEHEIPLRLCNIHHPMVLHRLMSGQHEGTLIQA